MYTYWLLIITIASMGGGDGVISASEGPASAGPVEGYEIVEIGTPEFQHRFHNSPRINNCGQIVFNLDRTQNTSERSWIMLYDNGWLDHVNIDTSYAVGDTDINDLGQIVWTRAAPGFAGAELVHYEDGELQPVFVTSEDSSMLPGKINNHGHFLANIDRLSSGCTGSAQDIYFLDEEDVQPVAVDGLSHQSGEMNGRDEIVWTRYNFCGFPFASTMRYALGMTEVLPTQFDAPQLPDIANDGVVVWVDTSGTGNIERWEDGITTLVGEGTHPSRNANDWLVYQFRTIPEPYQIWLDQPGEQPRLVSSDEDIKNNIWNERARINEFGEIAWRWSTDSGEPPYGIRFMRRIRTGDVDVDDDVDVADFARFPACYTGPVITDGLCVCRFLDIDHDRDVDWDDFNLFMASYTGPATDCTGRNIWDLADGLVAGTIQDCNVNGIDDECEIQEELTQRRGERGGKSEDRSGKGEDRNEDVASGLVPGASKPAPPTRGDATSDTAHAPPTTGDATSDTAHAPPTRGDATSDKPLPDGRGSEKHGQAELAHGTQYSSMQSVVTPTPLNPPLVRGEVLLGGTLPGTEVPGNDRPPSGRNAPPMKGDATLITEAQTPLGPPLVRGEVSVDINGNGVPDECDCPTFQAIHTNAMPSIKNRYLSFTPRVAYWTPMTAFIDPPLVGKRAAIRVKLVDLDRFPQLNGQVRWVGPPSTYPDASTPFGEFIAAQLQCEPYYADWSHAEYMHVYGSAIVPNSTYEVQIIAESCTPPLLDELKFSPPVTIVTREWGDVFEPYDGPSQPNFSDITRLVDAFRQAEGAIVKPRAQLQPQIVNPAGNVTFADISAGVDGFRGFVYPFTVTSCP